MKTLMISLVLSSSLVLAAPGAFANTSEVTNNGVRSAVIHNPLSANGLKVKNGTQAYYYRHWNRNYRWHRGWHRWHYPYHRYHHRWYRW